MAKPRILYLVHNFDNLAGVEIHTKALWRGLRPWFDTIIAHPEQFGGQLALTVRQTEEKVGRFPADPVPWPQTPYNISRNEQSLQQILEVVNPDLIHIQHFINWPLSVIDQCVAFGRPVFISFHDYFPFTPQFTMIGVTDPNDAVTPAGSLKHFGADISPYLLKRRNVIGHSLSRVKKLITPAPYLARLLENQYGVHVDVIEIGIEPFAAPPAGPKNPGPALRFGYVGSMIPQKGWDILARSFEAVYRRYPNSELLMFGGGTPPPLNFPGVRFLGGYKPEDLPSIMEQFDVGVIPSIFAETFSMMLSELWHARRPAAVSDIGALGERVSDGINGKKFRPGDIADIAAALIWFIENDGWRGWELPRPRLADAMLEQYRDLYRSTISNQTPRGS